MPLKFAGGFLLLIASCCLCGFGASEADVSKGTTAEPQEVDLAQFEAGQEVTNGHMKFGPHVACYYGSFYSYLGEKDEKGPPGPDTSLSEYYYPIISEQHPAAQELVAEYGSLEEVPLDAELPDVETFRVLVKAHRFDKLRDLPVEQVARLPSLQGLVVNRVDKLAGEELRILRSNFPSADFDTVLLVEEGRTPTPGWMSTASFYAGIVLCVMGPVLMIWGGVQWMIRLSRGAGPKPVLATVADDAANPQRAPQNMPPQPPFPREPGTGPPGSGSPGSGSSGSMY
jgi:hypothetical protein